MNTNSAVKERVIEASAHLFSSQGFNGTSTREIARLADVNEASMFRHFPRKQDLFWAALQSRFDRVHFRKELQTGLDQIGDPKLVVPLIVEFLVEIATYQPELLKLLGVSLLEMRPDAELIWRKQLAPIFEGITQYLERCIAGGTVRKLDISVMTVGFFTTILLHESMNRLLTGGASYANAAEAIATYSDYWLEVLLPNSRHVPVPPTLSDAAIR